MRSDATPVRQYAPNPARRTEVHRKLEASAGLSEAAAMLLVELDLFGEVRLGSDEHLPALAELEARGLAMRAEAPRACVHAVPSGYVRSVMESVREILALENQLAIREAKSRPVLPDPSDDGSPLSAERERAIVDDALAVIERSPTLPAASKVRVYLRAGPRYVRVFWTYAGGEDGSGSILHVVEKATGRVYEAKSWRQVGRLTGRVIAGFGDADG